MSQPIKVFVSYAHKDDDFKEELDVRLALIRRKMPLEIWTDGKITAGQLWDDEIKAHLENADVVLFLVSDYFLVSNYINNIEIERALDRHKQGKTMVIPIILRPTDFGDFEKINKFQALPRRAKPISTWDNVDEAWLSVSQGLKDAFESVKGKTPNNNDSDNNSDNKSNNDTNTGGNSPENPPNKPSASSTSNQNTGDGIALQQLHANRDIHIHMHQNSPTPPQDATEPPKDTKATDFQIFDDARIAIAETKIKDAIESLMNYTKTRDRDKYTALLLLLSRFNRLQKQVGFRRQDDIDISTNQIELSLTSIIEDLEKEAGK